jgi:CheY-like chemotaxis protein
VAECDRPLGGREPLRRALALAAFDERIAMSVACPSVLVVEDDPLLLELTSMLLADGGLEVSRATSCEEAMTALERGPVPNVVVTDIGLGGARSGLELARTIADRWPHIRLIIVSGEQRPTRDKYPQGAVFFTKPYADGALLSIINAPIWEEAGGPPPAEAGPSG